jgi:hypothetical protein
LALAIALFTILALAPAISHAKDLDRRIPASPGGLLQVDLDMGDDFLPERLSLDIRSHDADEVWAVADLSGPGGSAVSFRLEHDARGVRLYGRSGGLLAWLLGGPGVSVRVWVPREYSVDVRCRAGSVQIEDVSGSVRARVGDGSIEVRSAEGSLNLKIGAGPIRVTEMVGDVAIRAADGPLDLEWVTGNVEARTGSGDIRARHMDGDVAVRTDSGEIEATELRGQTEARTERGAVYARFAGPPAGLLETYGGSVHVVLPEHSGTHLDARTRRGNVQFGAGIEADGLPQSGQYVGDVNGGGAALRIFTDRGSIRVDRR